jgi:hypothetical protein
LLWVAVAAIALACSSGTPAASGTTSSSSGPAAAGSTTSSATTTTSAATTTTGTSKFSCPTAAATGAAIGESLSAPQVVSGAGGTQCTYQTSPSGGNDVVLTAGPATATEVAALAKDQGSVASRTQVPGIGSVAYLDVGISGISSELFFLDGTEGIEVTAFGTPAQMEAVARVAISG